MSDNFAPEGVEGDDFVQRMRIRSARDVFDAIVVESVRQVVGRESGDPKRAERVIGKYLKDSGYGDSGYGDSGHDNTGHDDYEGN